MFALHGAERRLLPVGAVALLFGAAIFFQPVAWALLAVFAGDVAVLDLPGFGPVIAVIHAATLGVLMPVAAGALVQILCVVTMQPPPPRLRVQTMAVLLVAGTCGLVAGMVMGVAHWALAGVAMAASAVALLAAEMARLLLGARKAGFPDTRMALWVALAALIALAALAVMAAVDWSTGWLPDHGAVTAVHAVLAVFGFMGMLVIGLSLILLPMLAIAEPPPTGRARLQIVLAAVGLAVAVGGLLAEAAPAVAIGSALGLAAATLHVRMMAAMLKKRLRRSLGGAFVLVRLSWGLILAGLALATVLAAGLVPADPGLRVLGILLLHGWLLSLVGGILQRILPFLASMHVMAARGTALSPAKLSWDAALRVHLVCHCAALALSLVGAMFGLPLPLVAGGIIGAVGGLAFAAFAATTLGRTLRHLHPSEVK